MFIGKMNVAMTIIERIFCVYPILVFLYVLGNEEVGKEGWTLLLENVTKKLEG